MFYIDLTKWSKRPFFLVNFLINLQFFLKNNRLNKGEYARKNGKLGETLRGKRLEIRGKR
jgi:hypothetical protein